MNVVVTSNKDFLMPLEVCIYSLCKNNKNINIYFINFSVVESDLESIRKTIESFDGCSFTIINLPTVLSKKFEYSDTSSCMIKCLSSYNLSIETYGKLLIPYLLPMQLDRCLYLDADIIVSKDISDFYNTDFKENFIVGMDALGYTITRRFSEENKSFNVGVILFNLEKIRKTGVLDLDKITEYIDESMINSRACSDELILNKVFKNNILFEDSWKYNLPVPSIPYPRNRRDLRETALNNAYILHYISRNKPWKEKCTLPKESKAIWVDYYNQCFSNR